MKVEYNVGSLLDRVLITGGNGFIGRHLIKELRSHNPSSIAIISNRSNFNEKYFMDRDWPNGTKFNCYTCDIRNRNQISDIFSKEKPQTCIHLAAKTRVLDSTRNSSETMEINSKGTLNVLSACHNSKVENFIFASSAAVYGAVKELPISENHALRPLSPYGVSKMLAEEYVSLYRKLKKIENVVILRIFNVYGNGQASEMDVISRFVARLSRGLPPVIYGDGLHTRDFISVHDVVRAMLSSIRLNSKVILRGNNDLDLDMIFNIGTGIPTSMNQLAKKLIKIFGLDLEPIYDREKVENKVILHSYADVTKAEEILKFVPKTAINEGLREMIDSILIQK